jgi:excinuclease ABC subunit B
VAPYLAAARTSVLGVQLLRPPVGVHEFEKAARIRDEIRRLEGHEFELPGQAASANVGVHLGRMQNSRVFRGVRTGSGGRSTRRSGR